MCWEISKENICKAISTQMIETNSGAIVNEHPKIDCDATWYLKHVKTYKKVVSMSAVQKQRPKVEPAAIYAPPDPFVTFTQTGPRSLQEEFMNDALFAVCVLFYSAVVWKQIPWLPIATHGVASSVAALIITIVGSTKKKTRKSCEGLAVAVGVCGAASALVDLVFIVQLISKYTNAETDEPHGFLSGVAPTAVDFAFL